MAQYKKGITGVTMARYKEPAMSKRPYNRRGMLGPHSTYQRFHYQRTGKYSTSKKPLPGKFKAGYAINFVPYAGAIPAMHLMHSAIAEETGVRANIWTGKQKVVNKKRAAAINPNNAAFHSGKAHSNYYWRTSNSGKRSRVRKGKRR